MNEYAILKDGVFVKFIRRDEQPEVAAHKGYAVLPVVRETVDNSTQSYTSQVTEEIIEPSRYLIRTTISDLSQAEIDASIALKKDNAIAQLDLEYSYIKALALTLFDAVNEIRVLKGQGPLTLEQFKVYVKEKL